MRNVPHSSLRFHAAEDDSPPGLGQHDVGEQSAPIGLTVRQVVELSGLSRSTIYEELRIGRLIARKLGRRTVILRGDFRSWLEGLPAMPARNTR
ncbi:MAG: helix-turn-helix domain-containing protein [Bauldia litoralis]